MNFAVYSDLFGLITEKNTAHARIAIGDKVAPTAIIIIARINVIAAAIKKSKIPGNLTKIYKSPTADTATNSIKSEFSTKLLPKIIGKCGEMRGSNKVAMPNIIPVVIKIKMKKEIGE